jgi:hypothetical protein
MKGSKNEIIRYEANTDQEERKLKKSGDGYVPLMRVPNIFRRLYGYAVYQRARKSGSAF